MLTRRMATNVWRAVFRETNAFPDCFSPEAELQKSYAVLRAIRLPGNTELVYCARLEKHTHTASCRHQFLPSINTHLCCKTSTPHCILVTLWHVRCCTRSPSWLWTAQVGT